jgi:hypothetical protein
VEFVADELRQALATIECRYDDCRRVGGTATIAMQGDHFAGIRCNACGRQIEWLAWPPAPQKRERRRITRRVDELTRLGDDYCEICLRGRFHLIPPDALEVHHADGDRDNDDPANLRLYCTACHRFVEWARLYLARGIF